MGDLPSMPLFVDDFEAATAHLNIEEDGAYNRLLRLCWRTPGCSVPADEKWIIRHMRINAETFERAVVPIIDEFFTEKNGRLFQKRQSQEFAYVKDVSEKRKNAGKKGGRAKALKNKETEPSKPLAPTPTLTPTYKETNVSLEEGANKDLQQAFSEFSEMAKRVGLSVPQRLTVPRRAKLRARLKECGGIDGWRAALQSIESNPFFAGDNQRGWKADLDFMLQEKSFTKLMEGGYDRGKPSNHPNGKRTIDDAIKERAYGLFEETRDADISASGKANALIPAVSNR